MSAAHTDRNLLAVTDAGYADAMGRHRLPVLGPPSTGRVSSAHAFLLAALALSTGAALLAGWAPLNVSIIAVFLFAGPHNWMEARYFLARLPGRWGRLRGYFLLGFGGVLVLTASFAALPWLADRLEWSDGTRTAVTAGWNIGLIAWIMVLVQMRSRTNPRRDWAWTLPAACALICVGWLWPAYVGLGLIYLHPLMALWLLDRELLRRRPEWSRAYRACLACLLLFLGMLWLRLADAPDLPGKDLLTVRIAQHAGADLLTGISTHLLVATHTFLEMLHYGVWLVAMPLVGMQAAPWKVGDVPLARRTPAWRAGVLGLLIGGGVAAVALWVGFFTNYTATRDVYFTVALLHVLAEVPFLLRSL